MAPQDTRAGWPCQPGAQPVLDGSLLVCWARHAGTHVPSQAAISPGACAWFMHAMSSWIMLRALFRRVREGIKAMKADPGVYCSMPLKTYSPSRHASARSVAQGCTHTFSPSLHPLLCSGWQPSSIQNTGDKPSPPTGSLSKAITRQLPSSFVTAAAWSKPPGVSAIFSLSINNQAEFPPLINILPPLPSPPRKKSWYALIHFAFTS